MPIGVFFQGSCCLDEGKSYAGEVVANIPANVHQAAGTTTYGIFEGFPVDSIYEILILDNLAFFPAGDPLDKPQ
jgi:hypothetical protein